MATVRNQFINPSGELGDAAWGSAGTGSYTAVWDTAVKRSGSRSRFSAAIVDGQSTAGYIVNVGAASSAATTANRFAVTPGETITLGVHARPNRAGMGARPLFAFYDAALVAVAGTYQAAYQPVAEGQWTLVTYTVTVPATAAFARAGAMIRNGNGTGTSAVGDGGWFDDAFLITGSEAVHFDGDTPTGAHVYRWEGTPHASTSTRTPIVEYLETQPAAVPLLDMWRSLPEHYQVEDEKVNYPLLRYMAGAGLELGNVDVILNRINFVDRSDGGVVGDTSDLADPTTADDAWLPWLAQLVGVELPANLTPQARRDAVQFASAGWRAGTKDAVADAAKSELTGTRYAVVYDHSVTAKGNGGQWDVLVVTRPTETPDATKVLTAIVDRGAKPAGVVLHHRMYESSWSSVETTYPTWSAIDALASWNKVQEAGL